MCVHGLRLSSLCMHLCVCVTHMPERIYTSVCVWEFRWGLMCLCICVYAWHEALSVYVSVQACLCTHSAFVCACVGGLLLSSVCVCVCVCGKGWS